MKRIIPFLLVCILFSPYTFAQCTKEKESSLNIGWIYTPLLSSPAQGFNLEVKSSVCGNFEAGPYISFAEKKMNGSFAAAAVHPLLSYSEYGWLSEYNFVRTKWFRMNFNLINGLALARLTDTSDPEYDEATSTFTSIVIDSDSYYLLQPGTDLAFELLSCNHDHGSLWLTLKGKYRFLFGNGNFTNSQQLSDYMVGAGIAFVVPEK